MGSPPLWVATLGTIFEGTQMKMRFPHDDEPEDPTANDCNYNFPQMLFAFCLGFTTMFVLFVDELQDFKGCPLPEYFQNEVKG